MMITAGKIAEVVNGELLGRAEREITGVASLKDADERQVSFLGNRKYRHQLGDSRAGVVLVPRDMAGEERGDKTFIVCENVDLSFSRTIMLFAPPPVRFAPGIHPTAAVDPGARIGRDVHIGANAVIEAGAEIGDGTVVAAGCYIGHDVKIGAQCVIYPNVTVMYRCVIGNKVVLHPGVVIGADGFGFIPTANGLVKVPQTGIVRIDDDVEIGANTTVDRARFDKTWIKSNVKIDDQVMVAHNVVVGESSILVAQSGIAGSATLGRGVILAAKAGVNGHITLGDGVHVAGTSGVVKSLPAGSVAVGTPAESQREFMARHTLPSRFEKLAAKVKELAAKLEAAGIK